MSTLGTFLRISGFFIGMRSFYLRSRGYNAHAGPAIGGDVNYIPVAIDAGLGMSGKNGILITKKNGPRVRLAAVYTDVENLPFSQKISIPGYEIIVRVVIYVFKSAQQMPYIWRQKPMRILDQYSLTTPNMHYLFRMTMAAHCVSTFAHSVMWTMKN